MMPLVLQAASGFRRRQLAGNFTPTGKKDVSGRGVAAIADLL